MEVEGKFGIKATVLARSISPTGIEMLTYELQYPRIILAELNTHRDKSRNSSSSRAIPFLKMLEQLNGRPVRFGQANPGMQDKGEDFKALVGLPRGLDFDPAGQLCSIGDDTLLHPEQAWSSAKDMAVMAAEAFYKAGYHKQVYNRLTEPFQMMKTVMSGTEWNNMFWLRDDDAADPTIRELTRVMIQAREQSTAMHLGYGEWHLPYVCTAQSSGFPYLRYYIEDVDGRKVPLTLEEAIIVSCARSAAVSFRNEDYMLDKCMDVYNRLVGDERKHASALEHQATPIRPMDDGDNWVNIPEKPMTWQHGISHMDRKMRLWSGNLRGWIQYRKTVPGENVEG